MFKTFEIHFTAPGNDKVQIMNCLVVEGETTKNDFEKMAAARIWGDTKRAGEIKLLATLVA
jgi:hypothetical protein